VTEIIVLESEDVRLLPRQRFGEHIEKIYLACGSAKVPGLVEACRQEFSMRSSCFNPFQKINGSGGWRRAEWSNRTQASWLWRRFGPEEL